MHDYYITRYTATRLGELRAEATREQVAAASRHTRGHRLWAAVRGAIDGWIVTHSRPEEATCCA